MNFIFLFFFILTAALYIDYSRRERSYMNALTWLTLLKCITEFVLEPIIYNSDIFDYSVDSFFYIYLASFLAYAFLIFGARRSKILEVNACPSLVVRTIVPWVFLGLSILLYLPIFIEFKDYLLDPRYIYEQTRTGYGIQFFGSAFLTSCSLVLFLLSNRRFHFIYIFIVIFFTISKGSKGQILTIMQIYGIWAVYILRKRFDFKRTLVGVILVSLVMVVAFVVNFRGEIDSLALTVANYSDYNRNASLILDDKSADVYYGRLGFENFIFSKIPRVIWADKPKNFGSFYLSEFYFPRIFDLDQGAPSFGIGVYFADFGFFAFFVIPIIYFFTGKFLKHFILSCERNVTVFSFVMLLFFADVNLLPAGVGYFLLEHLLIAYVLQKIVSLTSCRVSV